MNFLQSFENIKCFKVFLKVDINLKRFLLCLQYTINMGNFELILGILKTEIGNYLSSELATLTHCLDDSLTRTQKLQMEEGLME